LPQAGRDAPGESRIIVASANVRSNNHIFWFIHSIISYYSNSI